MTDIINKAHLKTNKNLSDKIISLQEHEIISLQEHEIISLQEHSSNPRNGGSRVIFRF
jgi:hypothetical protein